MQDAVDLALTDMRYMERRLRAAEESLADASDDELAAYGELLIAYEERGGYTADTRVDAAPARTRTRRGHPRPPARLALRR
ncbi:hypothetical protein [Streptomyces iakyrus]